LSVQEDRDLDQTRRYVLIETFDLGDQTEEVAEIRAERAALAAIERRLVAQTRDAARLLSERGISRRDTAEVLGISFQRVSQLVNSP
jgi:DNA-directed RNA polymerase specialized sigma subunit